VRLTIYIALLFFLFNFTSNVRAYVPVTASGTSFAEMAFLYMPLFVGIYLVLSILGGWVSDFLSQDSRKLIVATLLDSFAVLSAVIVSACWIVVQSLYTSKTLIGMMPDNLWKAEFLLGLSFGLIFNLGKAAWTFSRTHKKPHLPMFHRGKQSQRVPIALETA
jgi:flagellar biosynthesis protein FliQ